MPPKKSLEAREDKKTRRAGKATVGEILEWESAPPERRQIPTTVRIGGHASGFDLPDGRSAR
jgi:hypothetical protein